MDCLVNLYNLPEYGADIESSDTKNFNIRRAMAYEKSQVLAWVEKSFSVAWTDECSVAFSQNPISCFIATHNGNIVGFACYDCTQKNFFGPMGVAEKSRQKGVGSGLLITCLCAMKNDGYAYAIIGGCDGQMPFYSKVVGAISIDGSTPGVYTDRLNSCGNNSD